MAGKPAQASIAKETLNAPKIIGKFFTFFIRTSFCISGIQQVGIVTDGF
jgi:hypothetical protein